MLRRFPTRSIKTSLDILDDHARPGIPFRQRPLVLLLSPHKIIKDAERNRRKCQQDAVVHVLRRRWSRRRPETPEQHKEDVDAGIGVVDDAEDAGEVPGSPGELGFRNLARGIVRGGECRDQVWYSVGIVEGVRGIWFDLSGCASPEEQSAGDEVGHVEAGGGEGDDVFEDGGGADVD